MAPEGADVSMSADSNLCLDDEDKSVPDASAPVSVGGADVVESPLGGRVSDSPQPEHEVEASDDDEVEYVETKKPQFGPADDVEVVEVGSDPDDKDDEVELMKDMEVSSLKSSGTASIRTPVQVRLPPVLLAEVQVKPFVADQVRRWERDVSERSFPPNIKYDWPHDHLDSSSYLSAVLTTSEYLRKRTSMAAEADAWIAEMELTRRTFGAPGDRTAVTIPLAHYSLRECVAVLQTQLFEAGFGFLNWVPGWFRTRANKAHPDLVRNVVEEMLILSIIEMVELSQLLVQAAEIQVSARTEQPCPEGVVLEPDVEMSDREVELLGRDYVRMLKASGLQKPRSPRGPSVGAPGPKRIQRVPALAPPSSIPTSESPQSVSSSAFRSLEGARPGSMSSGPESSVQTESQAASSLFGTTGGSDESLTSAMSGSRTSRESSSGSSRFSWGRDAGGHVSAVPMAMTARTLGGENAVGPVIAIRSHPDVGPSAQVRRHPIAQAAKRVTDAAGPVDAPRPNVRTTSVQTSPRPVTSQPDLATSRPNLYPESSGVINDDVIKGKVRRPSSNLDELLVAQLRATLDVAPKTGAAPTRVKTESAPEAPARKRPDVRSERKAATEGEARRGAQPDAAKRARPANAKSAERKGRGASSKITSQRRALRTVAARITPIPTRALEAVTRTLTVPTAVRLKMSSRTSRQSQAQVERCLPSDRTSTRARQKSLAVRTRWLERFQSIAVQGGWTDKVKIYEMKLKLSATVRNWRANLRPKVMRDWKKFLKEFREMYCKAKTSDSERYYTMMPRKSESPLEFYYRLNKVADKAGIDFDSPSKQRERHLKVFTKKLLDSRLRTTLQGQRIRKLRDLDLSVPDEPTSFKMKTVRTTTKTTGKCVFRIWWRKFPIYHRPSAPPRGVPSLEVIRERMEAKHTISQVPSSGSSRTPDGGLLRMECFDRRPDHPVLKADIASSSLNAAMILDILPRAAGPTSSVIAVAA
ncbi:unnamed protein product [Phytophthora fragariaefolia]|uniref:Unnamed protein product n=1 Tax=Phytophthora fragariaefolia TaxID=1490495 RepID=A0A9W7CX15_9STRA|nr:unnamed protein product [Phytophthora fragariaefolia]